MKVLCLFIIAASNHSVQIQKNIVAAAIVVLIIEISFSFHSPSIRQQVCKLKLKPEPIVMHVYNSHPKEEKLEKLIDSFILCTFFLKRHFYICFENILCHQGIFSLIDRCR